MIFGSARIVQGVWDALPQEASLPLRIALCLPLPHVALVVSKLITPRQLGLPAFSKLA